MPIKIAATAEHDRRDLGAEDPEQARHRDRHEQRLLPAEGGQVVEGQRSQGERHQHLEGAALERPFLDPVDLEDRQEKCQVNEVAQERPEAATARFGLARIEARIRPLSRLLGCFRPGQILLVQCPSRPRLATELRVSAPMGPPPSRLIRSTGVALIVPRYGRLTRAGLRKRGRPHVSRADPSRLSRLLTSSPSHGNARVSTARAIRMAGRQTWGARRCSGSVESAGAGSSVNR